MEGELYDFNKEEDRLVYIRLVFFEISRQDRIYWCPRCSELWLYCICNLKSSHDYVDPQYVLKDLVSKLE